ncbi:MAG: hypothetical protein LBJ74_05250 [Heliobacteriaceae bacterium]|jgi:hypothetical protein|nr:hypothetical protein [Heliobacteriaceae bacterium]
MLTIQPGFTLNTNFCAMRRSTDRRPSPPAEEFDDDLSQEDLLDQKEEMLDAKENFEKLANNAEAKLPQPVKKVMKAGAFIAGAAVGGFATAYGGKMAIELIRKTGRTKAYKNFASGAKKVFSLIGRGVDALLDLVAKPIKAANKKVAGSEKYKKFLETSSGKKFVNFKNKAAAAFEKVDKKTDKWYDAVVKKKNQFEKWLTNALGVSGAVGAGGESLKAASKENTDED